MRLRWIIWGWPLCILLFTLAVTLITFLFPDIGARSVVIMAFLFVIPGMVVVRFFRIEDIAIELMLAIALSFAIDAFTAGIILYTGQWSPQNILNFLIGFCFSGAVAQLAIIRPTFSQKRNAGRYFLFPMLLFSLLLPACSTSTAFSSEPVQNAVADIKVTINTTTSTGVSQFSPGITHVDQGLDYPQGNNNLNAITNAKALIKHAFPYEDTAIMAWGAPDPWPDPSQPEPTNWQYLDNRLHLITSTGGIPVITLSEAPWWMKGQLQANGTTRLLTGADEWLDIGYNSRILDNQMNAWLHLVQRVAERYMAPPYNVRYFQVWNELKGYYNPGTNAYDYNVSPGNPNEPMATHGYTYMYNQVYKRLMQVSNELHRTKDSIKVGGPYVVMDTWSSPRQSQLSTIRKAYGIYDERSLDVVLYWLQHKIGAGFITLDSGNANRDNVNNTDPFTASERFGDITQWLRSLDPTRYPGATTLPVWFAEWYATPYGNTPNDDYNNAIKAYAMINFLQAGGSVAFSWGWASNSASDTNIWTATTQAGGGRPLPVYYSYKALKDYFGPGTRIYQTVSSDPASIAALASSSHIMLINKTTRDINVGINNKVVLLKAYQVAVFAL